MHTAELVITCSKCFLPNAHPARCDAQVQTWLLRLMRSVITVGLFVQTALQRQLDFHLVYVEVVEKGGERQDFP